MRGILTESGDRHLFYLENGELFEAVL